jgi:hypothetical protein
MKQFLLLMQISHPGQDCRCHFQGYRDSHVILIKAGGSLIGCFGTMHALYGLVADVSRSTEVHFPSLPNP